MANKTIPQLPEQTGKTNDDLLVIVDSGETTTSKIKVSTLLDGVGGGKYIAADGTNNIVPDYYPTTSINAGASESAIIAGTGNTIPNSTKYSVIVGSLNSTNNSERGGVYSSKSSTIAGNSAGVVVGGESNTSGSGGYYNGVFAGQSNTSQGIQSALIGGASNETTGTSQRSVIAGGQSNDISGVNSFIGAGTGNIVSSTSSSVVGGQSNTMTGNYSGIIGGVSNINGGNYAGMLGGRANGIGSSPGDASVIVGGRDNSIANNTNGRYNGIYSSYDSTISSAGAGFYNSQLVILGGDRNSISHSGTYPCMTTIGGQLNSITDATNGVIIGSSGSTLSGHTNSVIIGGAGLTSNTDNEVQVPNLTIANYASLNFSGDTAAATGGVPLGGVYHDNGAVRIRIT